MSRLIRNCFQPINHLQALRSTEIVPRHNFDEVCGVVEIPVFVYGLSEPSPHLGEASPCDLVSVVGDIIRHLIEHLAPVDVPEGVAGEVAEGAAGPVGVLHHSLGVVLDLDAKIFPVLLVPSLGELVDADLACEEVSLYLEPDDDVELGLFVHAINMVEPSKIRVEADEVTYGLHVIIRFEIEKDLFAEKLTVEELPQVWNEKYREYLGVEVENDSEGVMQDTHWAGGAFGYFPSYALGNIYGGQMLEKMAVEIPDYKDCISKGSFKEINSWLVDNVHKYGNLYDPADFIKVITGDELRIEPFLNYLDDKYSKLYGY